MTRVISIISGKGGVGKTTVTSNLGSVLSYKFDNKTIVVDCNITTSHLGLYLGMYYCPITLNKALMGELDIKDTLYDHSSGMKVIPASLSLEDLKGLDLDNFKYVINDLVGEPDIIFLDVAPGLGREAISAIKASDEVLYVTTPFVPPVMDVIRCNQVINEIGIKPLGIIMNMVTKKKYELTANEIEDLAEIPVISSIPRDKNIPRSLVAKIPIVQLKPNSPASREFNRLAAYLIGKEYSIPEKVNPFHNLLRFFRLIK